MDRSDPTQPAGFLQSQDRIHRLGLNPDVETKFTLLLSKRSIDQSVDRRLRDKVVALSVLMDDPGLVEVSLPEVDIGDAAVDQAVEPSDAEAIAAHLANLDMG